MLQSGDVCNHFLKSSSLIVQVFRKEHTQYQKKQVSINLYVKPNVIDKNI